MVDQIHKRMNVCGLAGSLALRALQRCPQIMTRIVSHTPSPRRFLYLLKYFNGLLHSITLWPGPMIKVPRKLGRGIQGFENKQGETKAKCVIE